MPGKYRDCRGSDPPLSGLIDIRTASWGQCIQLIKEEPAGCSCLGPVKELPHSPLTLPDIPAGRQVREVNRCFQLQSYLAKALTCQAAQDPHVWALIKVICSLVEQLRTLNADEVGA